MAEREAAGDRFGLVGATVAGRYQVDRPVAEGGFAVVYRAVQAPLERFVALKVLKTPADLDAESRAAFRERFAAEARTIARLKHPFIVSVYDFGVDLVAGEPAPWMALEWLDGETLEAELDRRRGAGGRGPAQAVRLLRPIVDAVAYAHRRGIIHRDIKPANMMLVPTERGRVLRMMDFGISKVLAAGSGSSPRPTGAEGSPGFSPHYAAPEQVTFSRTGPFTDVHALGLVMTELLTDEAPFSEADDAHLFEQIMSPARPTPGRKGRRVGPLEKVLARAVALSPRRRWQDAGELLAALDSVALPAEDKRPPAAAATTAAPDGERTVVQRWPLAARGVLVDRLTVAAGTAAVLAAMLVLLWTLRPERAGLAVREELALAARATHAAVPSRRSRGAPGPWVVPLPPPSAPAAEPPPNASPVVGRRPRPLAEAMHASVRPRETEGPAGWTDPFGDGRVESRACRITVNSVPWSEVWVDGRNTAQHTPLVDYPIGCGHHQLEFRRADLGIDQAEPCDVAPEQPFKRRFSLAAASP
ncbi:MAG TPA: serine/threonine-protein kinase [Polyangia bacterium]|nr:serine/threonine-protein kinase [Polyangia bacterium]